MYTRSVQIFFRPPKRSINKIYRSVILDPFYKLLWEIFVLGSQHSYILSLLSFFYIGHMFLLLENQMSRMPSKVFNRHLTLSCVKHVLYLVLLFSFRSNNLSKKTQNIKLKLSTLHFLGVKRVSLQITRLINARSTALTSSFIMSPLDFHGFV